MSLNSDTATTHSSASYYSWTNCSTACLERYPEYDSKINRLLHNDGGTSNWRQFVVSNSYHNNEKSHRDCQSNKMSERYREMKTNGLKEVAEEEIGKVDFSSTQRIRRGLFRVIKRQYPTVQQTHEVQANSNFSTDISDFTSHIKQAEALNLKLSQSKKEESFISMRRSARRKLTQLRKCDPAEVDIETGLLWIRLELNELREQDKSILLQLDKVYSNLQELKSEINQKTDEDFEYSCEDFYQLPAWWTCQSKPDDSVVPASPNKFSSYQPKPSSFSASDGAQFLRGLSVQHYKRRRGRSPLPIALPTTSPMFNF